jgi:hypothetical protein
MDERYTCIWSFSLSLRAIVCKRLLLGPLKSLYKIEGNLVLLGMGGGWTSVANIVWQLRQTWLPILS